ncbi:MAG TPA: AI-2E family transporter [Acidimicrobiales bacterium]|nr:AI-2E family transporter [Acidimicrobiales bacterium]
MLQLLDHDTARQERKPSNHRGLELLDRASAVALRLLVLALAFAVVLLVLVRLRLVVLPVALALTLATVLAPPVARLRRTGLRPGAAAALVLGACLVVLLTVGAVVVPQVAGQLDDVGDRARDGLDQLEGWAGDRLAFWPDDRSVTDEVGDWVGRNGDAISAGVASGALLFLEVVAGVLLALVVLFFFLKDGERLCERALSLVRPQRRHQVSAMARRSWGALAGYVRGAVIDGLVEAVLVAIALAVLGIPLVLPLAAITFFAGFLPIIGAIVAGTVAALVALVAGGRRTPLSWSPSSSSSSSSRTTCSSPSSSAALSTCTHSPFSCRSPRGRCWPASWGRSSPYRSSRWSPRR